MGSSAKMILGLLASGKSRERILEAALGLLADFDCSQRNEALDAFYTQWKNEPLVIDGALYTTAGTRRAGDHGYVVESERNGP